MRSQDYILKITRRFIGFNGREGNIDNNQTANLPDINDNESFIVINMICH